MRTDFGERHSSRAWKEEGAGASSTGFVDVVNIWLTDRRAGGVRRAAVADADCPTLIRIVRLLTGAAGRHGNCSNRVADHVAGRVGGYNRKCEFIAALDARRQARVNQVGRRGRRDRASPGGTQIRNGVGKPAIAILIHNRAFGQSLERPDGSSFVRRHFRLHQVRNGNGGNDQNNRDDDQQFDEGKTLLPLVHAFSRPVSDSPRVTARGTICYHC